MVTDSRLPVSVHGLAPATLRVPSAVYLGGSCGLRLSGDAIASAFGMMKTACRIPAMDSWRRAKAPAPVRAAMEPTEASRSHVHMSPMKSDEVSINSISPSFLSTSTCICRAGEHERERTRGVRGGVWSFRSGAFYNPLWQLYGKARILSTDSEARKKKS